MPAGIGHGDRIAVPILRGVLLLFVVQLSVQIFSVVSNPDFKGGLINIRTLVWEGLQTQPVILALLHHAAVYILILAAVSAIATFCARFIRTRLTKETPAGKLQVLVLLILYAALMVVNAWHFPNSLARLALVSEWQAAGDDMAYYAAVTICLAILALAVVEMAMAVRARWTAVSAGGRRKSVVLTAILISTAAFAGAVNEFAARPAAPPPNGADRPNIILIGLDSVRTDIIADRTLRRSFLPHLDRFLEQDNTNWTINAYTPIARTYAAWYALLSGREPRLSGIRYNLQKTPDALKRDTIAHELRVSGYYTAYGTDEKRFSAIDETYGFDDTFGPPVGAAEWILSLLEDTPLHNLLRDTALAPALFPHTFGNRASYTTHRPEDFVRLLERRFRDYRSRRPLFLSIHLCLSHWPYTWSTGNAHERQSLVKDYFDTLAPMDRQFGAIMGLLEEGGVLENSVVFVFTDHGEGLVSDAMEEDDPRWKDFRAHLPRASDVTPGHGSDLLTITQNQILISVQDNTGKALVAPGRNERFGSLLDITPTVARIAGLDGFDSDGIDLAVNGSAPGGRRVIFMETGIDLAALKQATLNVEELVREGASAYEIGPDGLLQVKEDYHQQIMNGKQKGVTDGRFILSNRPGAADTPNGQVEFMALDVEQPARRISGREIEQDPDLRHLKDRLMRYYGGELQLR